MNDARELLDSTRPFLTALASGQPTPGGGAVASLAGALAASLTSMVANLTVGKKKFAAVEAEFQEVLVAMDKAREDLLEWGVRDAEAFDGFMQAWRLPKSSDAEKAARKAAMASASIAATEGPMGTLRALEALLPAIQMTTEHGNQNALSDAGIAALLVETGARAAAMNVQMNLPGLPDDRREEFASELKTRLALTLKGARAIATRVEESLSQN